MMRTLSLPLLLAVTEMIACSPVKAIGHGDVSDGGGESADGGAESVDGGAADGGGEAGDGGGEAEQRIDDDPVDFVFWFDGDTTEAALELAWLGELGNDDIVVGDVHATSGIAGAASVRVSVPPPYESDLLEIDGYPGTYLGFLLPLVGEDRDGSGEMDSGGEYWGAGMVWPTYLYGTVPAELLGLGFRPGWNAVELDFENDGYPRVYSVEEVPVAVTMRPVAGVEIGGTFEPADDWRGNPRLSLIPQVMLEGEPISSLLYDQGLDEEWHITVLGRPPSTHIVEGDGVSGAAEFPIAYGDIDLSGGLSEGDTGGYLPCFGGAPVLLTWYDPPTDPALALYGAIWGSQFGWGIARVHDDPETGETTVEYLDEAAATDLALSPDCPLE